MSIKVLPDNVVAGISAGEVIERPASVVKELLENSADSGATRIKVEVESGGMKLIRVTDNGRGIPPKEAALAFQRYATSKLTGLEDLQSIDTFGFRGEALAAIASSAEIEMLTRVSGQNEGVRVTGGEGKSLESSPIGCETGTMISVRNLFRSIPARLKFMRSPRSENSAIARAVEPYILARPDIHIILVVDGEEKINAPVSSNPAKRSASLFGTGADSLVNISLERNGIKIAGLAQPPGMVHARGKVWILVNGRPVEDRGLRGAMIAAYGGQIPRDMFPDAVIQVEVPPSRLDVNVHPAKSEVRFADPYQVRETLISALHMAFRGLPSSHQALYSSDQAENGSPFKDASIEPWNDVSPDNGKALQELFRPGEPSTGEQPVNAESKPFQNRFSVIGQVLRTYIVAHNAFSLFLVDQHAAHEKIIFERIFRLKGGNGSQQMLIPATIDLSPSETAEAEQYRSDLEALGFDFDSMGGRTYVIRGIPSQAATSSEPGRLFRELLSEKSSMDARPGSEESYRRFAAGVACKMAIKAGDLLDVREMEALLAELSALNDPRSCPHGRPTMIEISGDGLARMFKRT